MSKSRQNIPVSFSAQDLPSDEGRREIPSGFHAQDVLVGGDDPESQLSTEAAIEAVREYAAGEGRSHPFVPPPSVADDGVPGTLGVSFQTNRRRPAVLLGVAVIAVVVTVVWFVLGRPDLSSVARVPGAEPHGGQVDNALGGGAGVGTQLPKAETPVPAVTPATVPSGSTVDDPSGTGTSTETDTGAGADPVAPAPPAGSKTGGRAGSIGDGSSSDSSAGKSSSSGGSNGRAGDVRQDEQKKDVGKVRAAAVTKKSELVIPPVEEPVEVTIAVVPFAVEIYLDGAKLRRGAGRAMISPGKHMLTFWNGGQKLPASLSRDGSGARGAYGIDVSNEGGDVFGPYFVQDE